MSTAAELEHFTPAAPPEGVAGVVANEIVPFVRAIDDGLYPEAALRALGRAGSFSHHLGGRVGTGGLLGAVDDMALVGETCLSSAFCMWCQNALAYYIERSPNAPLRKRVLPSIASADRLGGTGLSNPMKAFAGFEPLALMGRRVAGGYRVSGRLPWVSNIGEGHQFAVIFAAGNGRRVMALLDCANERARLMRNARFVALEGTATYTVGLKDAFIAEDDVIAEDASCFVPLIRQGFVLLQTGMALGLARGIAQAMLADKAARNASRHLPVQPEAILERASDLRERIALLENNCADPDRSAFLDTLRARLDASWLVLEASTAGVLQSGARGYLWGAEMDRRQREARFVAIVTPSIKHITSELARDDPSGIR